MPGRHFSRTNIKPSFRKLCEDFVPGPHEVIIGRGKRCEEHIGNKRFHALIRSKLHEYITANTKSHKSGIILGVISEIHDNSLYGGFVKKDSGSGSWYSTDEANARNTTAQSFRDALHEHYKSSRQFKQKRRRNGKESDGSSSESEPSLHDVPKEPTKKRQCGNYVQQMLREAENMAAWAAESKDDSVPSMISFEQPLALEDTAFDLCFQTGTSSVNKKAMDLWSVLTENFPIDPTEDPFEPTPISDDISVLPFLCSDLVFSAKPDPGDLVLNNFRFAKDKSLLKSDVRAATSA